ncbi:Na-translocating system protein MpsC family protein, partial [Brevibacillus borstelensis]|uniref:DUF2294 domain-containing protein n=2 Tax=Brevibacillus TaxID=55080 RepID=UPI002E210E4F|nr:Na-translocating system protein MpsC family protein [Brevibacillus borstelensis]
FSSLLYNYPFKRNETMESVVQQTEISSYIGKILRDNFGKGPESIFVSIGHTFITVYIKNFLSPIEQVLLEQGQETTVNSIRDSLMQKLLPEIKTYINKITEREITEFYYDWNFHRKSGLFLGIASTPFSYNPSFSELYEGKEALHREIYLHHEQVQRKPENLVSYQLHARLILLIQQGVFVQIEKELIRLGHEDIVLLAKKNVEKQFLGKNSHIESVLNRRVIELFVASNARMDKSIIVFMLSAP